MIDRCTRWLWSCRAYPQVAYLAVALVVFLLVGLASELPGLEFAPVNPGAGPHGPFIESPRWLTGWARFDSGWYESIADRGYFFRGKTAQSSVAFFPLYPLLTRWLARAFGGDTSLWGLLVTMVSGFGAAMLYWRWVAARLEPSAARTAFAVLAVWPFALYLYGAVYADALFVFLLLAAFTCVERDRVPLAAMFGALATATRPVGIAVVLGLGARVLEQRGVVRVALVDRWRRSGPRTARDLAPLRSDTSEEGRTVVVRLHRLRRTDPTIVLSVAGLATYAAYLGHRFGDPLAFATAEAAPGWDQDPGPSVWFKAAWFRHLSQFPDQVDYFALATLQGLLALALIALVPLVVRRFGWGYGLYTLAILGLPVAGSKDFQGLGRYALAAFPAFAILGERLACHRVLRRVWLAVSFATLCIFSVMYARGRYVA